MAEAAEAIATTPTPDTLPPAAPAPDIVQCSHCDQPAVSTYLWDWGQAGACCPRHQFELAQRQKPLKRQVRFSALSPNAPPPIARDERVQFHARILAAEDELQEAKGRTSALYEQKQALAGETVRLGRLLSEQERRVSELQGELAHVGGERDRALQELSTARDEVVRLQTLVDALQGASGLAPAHGQE
jgi:hypothetical protein